MEEIGGWFIGIVMIIAVIIFIIKAAISLFLAIMIAIAFIIAFIFVIAAPMLLGFGVTKTVQKTREKGINKNLAYVLVMFTVGLGISIGFTLIPGAVNPPLLIAIGVTGIPALYILLEPPIKRSLQVRKYRQQEQKRIEPDKKWGAF